MTVVTAKDLESSSDIKEFFTVSSCVGNPVLNPKKFPEFTLEILIRFCGLKIIENCVIKTNNMSEQKVLICFSDNVQTNGVTSKTTVSSEKKLLRKNGKFSQKKFSYYTNFFVKLRIFL